jgi:hypothetical protein
MFYISPAVTLTTHFYVKLDIFVTNYGNRVLRRFNQNDSLKDFASKTKNKAAVYASAELEKLSD